MNAAYLFDHSGAPCAPAAFGRVRRGARRLGPGRRLGLALSLAAIAAASVVMWSGILAVALKLAA